MKKKERKKENLLWINWNLQFASAMGWAWGHTVKFPNNWRAREFSVSRILSYIHSFWLVLFFVRVSKEKHIYANAHLYLDYNLNMFNWCISQNRIYISNLTKWRKIIGLLMLFFLATTFLPLTLYSEYIVELLLK